MGDTTDSCASFSCEALYSFFVIDGKNDWIEADMVDKQKSLSD